MACRALEAPSHYVRKTLQYKPIKPRLPFLYQTRTIQRQPLHTSQVRPLEQLGESTDQSVPSLIPEPGLIKKIVTAHSPGYCTSRDRARKAHTQYGQSRSKPPESDHERFAHPSNSLSAAPGESTIAPQPPSPFKKWKVRRVGEASNPKFSPYGPYGAAFRPLDGQRQPGKDLWSISSAGDLPFDSPESETRQRKSTMTELERTAFAQLFESLVENTGEDDDVDGYEKFEREIEEEDDGTNYADLDMILDRDMGHQAPLIERYPNVLQGMAARAELEMAQSTRRRSKEEDFAERTGRQYDPVHVARRQEMRRIEQTFLAATTDVDLWNAIEDELFSKIRKLNLDGKTVSAADTDTEVDKTPPKPRRKKKAPTKGKAEKAAATTAPEVTPPEALDSEDNSSQSLAMFGRAYPALILLALRLFCRRAVLTPFALAVLPALKSIGLSSYVLGASTALYNELLSYRWRVFSDLGSMLSLLREMSSAGLSMDVRTFAILQSVVLYRHGALRGEYGEGNRCVELMMVRQKEGKEIKMWRQKVKAEVEEQALERLRRAETEQRVREEGAFAEDDDGLGEESRTSRSAAAG